MQIIVQEGRAILSLIAPIQAHDESLRSTSLRDITGEVKAFYRDYELVKIETRGGDLEILGPAIAGVYWLERGRRYQLQVKAEV
jgi:hypothetical protein